MDWTPDQFYAIAHIALAITGPPCACIVLCCMIKRM